MCPPGGGCRLLSRSASVSIASVGTAVCVFEGALINAGTLAEDYAPVPEDELTPAPTALTSAELMCHLYAKVGVELLGLLRGSFTFVLYESKTSRVLAARDGGGRCPLFQARTGKGSLVVSNSGALLEASGCTEKLEFQPGEFKYGWSATPRRYQPADHARLSRRSLDLPGAAHPHHQQHPHNHHHHGNHFHGGSRNGSRRTSLDLHPHPEASPAAAAAAADSNGAAHQAGGGRNHHHNRNQQQQQQASGGSVAPHPQPASPHPHRTYVVSAEDSRIVKAAAQARQQQQQQQPAATPARPAVAAAAAGSAAAAAASPAGTWTASAPPGRTIKDTISESGGGQGQNQGQRRGGSARGGSSAHHNRRRSSMDHQGSWRLGSGQGISAAGGKSQQAGSGQEPQQQQASQPQQQQHPQQTGPKQQHGPKQQQQQQQQNGGGTPVGKQQQQQPGTPNGGRQRGRDGRQSLEGRTPPKQEQQKDGQARAPVAAAAASAAAVGAPSAAALRVDAAEFVCTRSVAAGVPMVPLAAAAIVSAP
ncbi:hypothetical protein PLESTM_001277900 [Pleodorina starrii]|nr:hypothetical protein PLESTM_001277900 [Pleodorina starrii]